MRTEAERKVHKLARFLDWILTHNEAGLNILLGNLPPLSALDIYEMKCLGYGPANADLGVRITGGCPVNPVDAAIETADREERIVREAGGWEAITRAVRQYRAEQPKNWRFFAEHSLYVRPGGAIHDGDGGMSAELRRKFGGISPRTMRRRRNRILRSIANRVYMTDGELRDDRGNYVEASE